MSASDEDEGNRVRHPRETTEFFGHASAEQLLLESYRSGQFPHAWLIGGERGIGKATLAYRLARFVLAYPDLTSAEVLNAKSLSLAKDHPAFRRVATQAHGDLLVLERTLNEKGRLRQDIAVEDVRRAIPFFGSTAGEGGWRVAVVDAIDELNAAGANALLKIIEEPPPRALLILISHAPGRTLATIRSRCRLLTLRPIGTDDVARAVAAALNKDPPNSDIQAAAAASGGSVDRALMFLVGTALELRQRITALLERLPQLDPRALHALGDSMIGTEPALMGTFVDTINDWLSARLHGGALGLAQTNAIAETFEQINQSAREVEIYNLDRRPFVFQVFDELAAAARG